MKPAGAPRRATPPAGVLGLATSPPTVDSSPGAARLAGWREWAGLPALGVPALKAKLDTGARTSALHTCWLQPFYQHGQHWVRFHLRPGRQSLQACACQAPIADQRWVTDSGGHREKRWVIVSQVQLADLVWEAELTLTARDNLLFRLLLGRTALRGRFLIDPNLSYHLGRSPPTPRTRDTP